MFDKFGRKDTGAEKEDYKGQEHKDWWPTISELTSDRAKNKKGDYIGNPISSQGSTKQIYLFTSMLENGFLVTTDKCIQESDVFALDFSCEANLCLIEWTCQVRFGSIQFLSSQVFIISDVFPNFRKREGERISKILWISSKKIVASLFVNTWTKNVWNDEYLEEWIWNCLLSKRLSFTKFRWL